MADSIESFAARQFGVVNAEQAALCGYSSRETDRLCARGAWWRARRGIFLPGPAPAPGDEIARHRVEIAAALLALNDKKAVVADVSAAALWGFEWTEAPSLSTVHLARPEGKDRVLPGVRIRRVRLPDPHVVPAPNGMPALSPARLLVDFARRLGLRPVLVMADAALRTGRTTRAEIDFVLEQCSSWPGGRAAARNLAYADRRAGSPAESLARAIFIEWGLTGFDLQYVIRFPGGGKAEVDLCFPAWRLVFEIDGKGKYEDKDSRWKEKLREDRIRDREYHVVRLTWAELTGDEAALRAKVDEGFRRAATLLRVTGRS
jgi:very-short-patch-repair endonuclease